MSNAPETFSIEVEAPDGSTYLLPGWVVAALERVTSTEGSKLVLHQPGEPKTAQSAWVVQTLARVALADLERHEALRLAGNIIDIAAARQRLRKTT